MNQLIKHILLFSGGLMVVSCNSDKQVEEEALDSAHEKVERKQEEGRAYLLPGLDHGLLQSPINILSSEANSGKHNVTLNFKGKINKVENLGHTVQLDFEPGDTITFDDKTFEFKQLHFHTPSEHLVDGVTYPMEMHVVNTLKNQAENETTEYLVIAFLFKMGEENAFIKTFIDLIPEGEHESKEINLNVVKESDFFADDPSSKLNSYYHYKGSLTTPPYTESVNWCVLKNVFEASQEQILKINEIEGDNARKIQSKYGRGVSDQ